MAHHLVDLLRSYLAHYGYWAVAVALLLENAGLPVPGETILLLASFLAYSEHRLRLPYIILIGTVAATIGDNIGFAIGHYGGRRFLARYMRALHISARVVHSGERIFRKYGSVTVFFARFVAGLRVIGGPLAGILRMPWKRFVLFNLLGAVLWVITISMVGFLFARHWQRFMPVFKRLDLAIAVVLALSIFYLWWQHSKTSE
ncbi:MAG: DedA family protein [Acidobacteria bacterium]|nr:MAG: DedA family protein [Acidobacteriota bacterium]PYY06543.1 MAG: DedA family protein [Acidobacteriota bacterium]